MCLCWSWVTLFLISFWFIFGTVWTHRSCFVRLTMEHTFSSPSIFGLPYSSSFTCCLGQKDAMDVNPLHTITSKFNEKQYAIQLHLNPKENVCKSEINWVTIRTFRNRRRQVRGSKRGSERRKLWETDKEKAVRGNISLECTQLLLFVFCKTKWFIGDIIKTEDHDRWKQDDASVLSRGKKMWTFSTMGWCSVTNHTDKLEIPAWWWR